MKYDIKQKSIWDDYWLNIFCHMCNNKETGSYTIDDRVRGVLVVLTVVRRIM